MEIERFLRERCESYNYFSFVNLELDKAGSEEVLCFFCLKPLLGTCIQDVANRYYHISCVWVPSKMESLLLHFRSGHDDLTFTGELQNRGKEDTVCFGCDEPGVGPGYECSVSDCKFLLHQSCAELPLKMQHLFHPDHTLSLLVPKQLHTYCEACGKDCIGCFSYVCYECKIYLDIVCARGRAHNTDECKHVFRPLFLRFPFTCDACGEEGKEIAALCNICQLLIHGKCVRFSRIIRITAHRHGLFITYSLREVYEVKEGNNIFCNLCYEMIKMKYGAYFCKKCDFVAHWECAYTFLEKICEESDDLDSDEEEEFDESLVEGAEEIQHFSHHHILSLSKKEVMDSKLCNGCMGSISAPFYSCTKCNYFLHDRCVHLPRKKKHILHRHKLTLVSQLPYFDGVFCCDACYRFSRGFSYNCNSCRFNLDVRCVSMPESLEHESHTHTLYLAINSTKRCNACERHHGEKKGVFVCTQCELVFCLECATLPFEASHGYHKHFLKFTFVSEAFSENYYCLICEEKRNEKDWIYYCTKCDFTAHIDCVVGRHPYIEFQKPFMIEGHEHPITFVIPADEVSQCDACGKAFRGWAIECAQCKTRIDSWSCLQKKSTLLTEVKRAIASGAEEVGETSTSTRGGHDSGAEEAGGTSAGTRGECDSLENIDSGAEGVGGTSISARGGCDFDEEIDLGDKINLVEQIDSSVEERGGLVQAPKAAVEIDLGAEDAGGTSTGSRGGRDLGERIDSAVEIDSGAEEAGELVQAPVASVIQIRRLSRVRRVIHVHQRRVLAFWRNISTRLHLKAQAPAISTHYR